MVEDLPGNSQRPRAVRDETPKKVEKIIQGEAVRRKKPLRKRIAETFVGGDARSVWSYVAIDVLIPAAKDAIADAFSQGIEKMLFGEARSVGRRTGRRPNDSYIAYNRYNPSSSNRMADPRDRDKPQMSRRARANFDFDEIILPTRVEAEEVIDRMFDLVSKYDMVTVADLYDLVGIQGSYTDEKYGWEDIRGAGVTRVTNGYLLDIPRPEPIR